MTADDKVEILFGGGRPLPPRMAVFKKREGPDTWFTIIEKAFIQLTSTDEGKRLYGDPQKGATLEQAWRTSGIYTGKWPICLLALGRPSVATNDIKKLIRMNTQQLVKTLSNILGLSSHAAATVLYNDGYRGHCITLLKYDAETSRFTFLDPWPETSLLAKDYNAAGIDAKHVDEQVWSITDTELEKVIFAAFVFQNLWAEYLHEQYYINYDEFKSSDFWSFFHITEKDRVLNQDIDNGNQQTTRVILKTGGFQSEIELSVTLDRRQRLKNGQLNVKRSWLIGSPFGVNPFALDIVKSFISTMVSPSDKQQVQELLEELEKIQNIDYSKQLLTERRDTSSILQTVLLTYLGAVPSCSDWPLNFSNISMSNIMLNGNIGWLQITITVDLVN